ncbi:tyrosine-type recombinase/integrase [Clostridium thermobutyricum]|uniref:tyrosine-type recombinase/integrase n=1 Tax=Clostridium thermobutyricum TaxID=29372 RepID=UPI0018AA4A9B|nr:tyrosine-type recombinase/integrase [Clostridium thermobutyricum]
MPKKRSIKSQFHYAITKNFKEGVKKRDYKIENGQAMDNKVFSYQELYRLKDVARDINNFLRENEIERRGVRDIKSEDINKFLDSKKYDCTQQTINSYKNSIYKLQEVVNKTYKLNVKWREGIEVPKSIKAIKSKERGVKAVISNEDYKKIIEYVEKNKCQSAYAIILEKEIGVRVSEIVNIKKENIDLERKEILFKNTKGGKKIVKKIKNINLVKEILDKNYSSNALFSIKASSVNRYLNRVQDKLGLGRNSFHNLRRNYAQNFYDNKLKEGVSEEKALLAISKQLNHRTKRERLMEESYIKRQK